MGRRVVLIPTHPLAGRVCRGGVVFVDEVPVAETAHGNDPRLPVRSSRPSDSLPGDELSDLAALTAWLDEPGRHVAIVDASTVDQVDALVDLVIERPDVLLAGPASVVGAVARAMASSVPVSMPEPALPGPIVVVCASLHPVSREQIARLRAIGGVEVVASSVVRRDDPEVVANEVAELAHLRVADIDANTVVLVGGDTAAAFIGDNVVRVFGSLGVGVSLGEMMLLGRPVRVVTKNGAFGTSETLVDLLTGGAPR
jgi:uncharacterized protein YgbK (DUF1537 family)